jgi:hypothetical protein
VKTAFVLILSLIFLAACSGVDSTNLNKDSAAENVDSTTVIDSRADVNQCCCFQSEKDFLAFFPDVCGSFIGQPGRTVEMKCITDTITQSNSTKTYANREGHIVAVTITDYCSTVETLRTDFALIFEHYKGLERQGEFNEFEVSGSYHGFSHFDPGARLAVVYVVVDNRFLVDIVDQQCENTKNVLMVYEHLPLQELAAFRK